MNCYYSNSLSGNTSIQYLYIQCKFVWLWSYLSIDEKINYFTYYILHKELRKVLKNLGNSKTLQWGIVLITDVQKFKRLMFVN